MRKRFDTTTTIGKVPIYSSESVDWILCPRCRKKLFKAIERKESVVEVKCKCGSVEKVKI